MKYITSLIFALALSGCTIDYRHDPHTPTGHAPIVEYTEAGPSYVEVAVYGYDDMCFDDPYWHQEEWCEYYDDGTYCCVWYADGWFEEWCQWDYDYCWEYNGSF